MSDAWPRIRTAFEHACSLPPTERSAWLDQAGLTPSQHAEVVRLLAAEATAGGFLTPPGDRTFAAAQERTVDEPGTTLGPFTLGRVLGRGGMGTVHEATQAQPQRRVALKVLHAATGSMRARQRFQDEIDALARLQHPGIAQVFAAGATDDGRPWFAMELLADALPLDAFARQHALALPMRLRLFEQVAAAVAHAHQRGVIHRDLKPANVLVLPDGSTRVIDFGIAHLVTDGTAASPRTLDGELMGTLAYMSPEQASGGPIDVRTDVYGLGALLFELLTDARPFDFAGVPLTQACRRLVDEDPPPPSRLRPDLPRELDWILAHAMGKRPEHRYPGVAELVDDLRRLQRHEPPRAAPPGAGYRLRKFVRRHRLGVAIAATVLGSLAIAFAAIATALVQTKAAEAAAIADRNDAEAQRRQADAALTFLLDMFSAPTPEKGGRELKMGDALARAARDTEQRFADQPAVLATISRTIGLAFFGLGELEPAERHLRAAVTWLERAHGPTDPRVLRARLDLAMVLHKQGNAATATAEVDDVEPLLGSAPDADLALVLAMRRADLLRARGDKQAAADLLTRTMAGPPGPGASRTDEPLMADLLLAGIRHELGDLDGAETLYRRAAAALLARKGSDHPVTLTAWNNLAMVQASRGDRGNSIASYERLLVARRRVLGDSHQDTIGTINNLAGLHYLEHNYAEAARLYEAARAALAPQVGEDHPVLALLHSNLATAERELGNFPVALTHVDRALAIRTKKLGAQHDATLLTRATRAEILRQAGDGAAAVTEFTAVLAAATTAEPAQLANAYRARFGRARAFLDQMRLDEAETDLRSCQETHAAALASTPQKNQLLPPDQDLERLAQLRAARK